MCGDGCAASPPVQSRTEFRALYRRALVTSRPSPATWSANSLADSHPSIPKMDGWQLPQNDRSVLTYSWISLLLSENVGNTERIQMFWLLMQLPPTRWMNEGSYAEISRWMTLGRQFCWQIARTSLTSL